MIEYTREELLTGLTEDEIKIATKVVSHVNFKSAYGHSPTICSASAHMLRLLDNEIHSWEASASPYFNEEQK